MMYGGPPPTMAPSQTFVASQGNMMCGAPPQTMALSGQYMPSQGNMMCGAPPQTMAPSQTMMPQQGMMPQGGMMYGAQQGQFLPQVSRPTMNSVANPSIMANNMQYGPSYQMSYSKRSTADKTAVKYTGFLPLEGVYEEDTCRIG